MNAARPTREVILEALRDLDEAAYSLGVMAALVDRDRLEPVVEAMEAHSKLTIALLDALEGAPE